MRGARRPGLTPKMSHLVKLSQPDILYNGDLIYVGTFPVNSGMSLIFTDLQIVQYYSCDICRLYFFML